MIARVLLAGLVLGPGAPAAGPTQQSAPNVLVIVLDDLGTDKLGFYGETPPTCPSTPCFAGPYCVPPPGNCIGPYPKTPNLNALRQEGILFTRAYGNPVCSPTRANIQTGRYGLRTGVGHITSSLQYPSLYQLPDAEVLLAELLRDGNPTQPYASGAFGKWHLTTTLPANYGHAVDNGYHHFSGLMGNVGNHFRWTKVVDDVTSSPSEIPIDATVPNPDEFTTDYWQSSHTGADALAWINAQTNPFLAYVCFNAPHAPLQVPPASLLPTKTLCELTLACLEPGDIVNQATHSPEECRLVYRAMVEALDEEIGNLLDGFTSQVKRDNTMVFVIGDNGTPGHLMQNAQAEFGGKTTMYETGIRVPLLVSGPLVPTPPPGLWTSSAPVDAVDLWLTIAQIAGANVNAAAPLLPLDSKSFLSVIQNPGTSAGNRTYDFSQQFLPNGIWMLPNAFCFTKNERIVSDGTYKYGRFQKIACPPVDHTEFLVLLSDETSNLLPLPPNSPHQPALDDLRAAMDAISGP